jgi:hypothetical protein
MHFERHPPDLIVAYDRVFLNQESWLLDSFNISQRRWLRGQFCQISAVFKRKARRIKEIPGPECLFVLLTRVLPFGSIPYFHIVTTIKHKSLCAGRHLQSNADWWPSGSEFARQRRALIDADELEIVTLTVDTYFSTALCCTDEYFTVDARKSRDSPYKRSRWQWPGCPAFCFLSANSNTSYRSSNEGRDQMFQRLAPSLDEIRKVAVLEA